MSGFEAPTSGFDGHSTGMGESMGALRQLARDEQKRLARLRAQGAGADAAELAATDARLAAVKLRMEALVGQSAADDAAMGGDGGGGGGGGARARAAREDAGEAEVHLGAAWNDDDMAAFARYRRANADDKRVVCYRAMRS